MSQHDPMDVQPRDLTESLLKQVVRELRTIFFVLVTIAGLLLVLLATQLRIQGIV